MKLAIDSTEQKELSSTTRHQGRGTVFGISVALDIDRGGQDPFGATLLGNGCYIERTPTGRWPIRNHINQSKEN